MFSHVRLLKHNTLHSTVLTFNRGQCCTYISFNSLYPHSTSRNNVVQYFRRYNIVINTVIHVQMSPPHCSFYICIEVVHEISSEIRNANERQTFFIMKMRFNCYLYAAEADKINSEAKHIKQSVFIIYSTR